jgi:hypothetical protein
VKSHVRRTGLDQDTLARRRVLGEDHPDTLTSADNLAMLLSRLGESQAARELAEDILARRRVQGEDHPDILRSAFILAGELTELGEYQAARELNEDILARRRRVLGDDHPDTMVAAAFDLILRGLDIGGEPSWMAAIRGSPQEARKLNEDEPG